MKSVFTNDLTTCWLTGQKGHIEVHHIFPGPNRKHSTKYGFVVPLHASVHPNGAFCTLPDDERVWTDTMLKRTAQRYFEQHHGTREDFVRIFGRSYIGYHFDRHGQYVDDGEDPI